MKRIPKIGNIVIYKPTKEDQKNIKFGIKGFQNNESRELPGVIVAVWGEGEDPAINIKVMIDGNNPDLWITSVHLGKKMGTWAWPVK